MNMRAPAAIAADADAKTANALARAKIVRGGGGVSEHARSDKD